ncbi:hypothetical protein [Enterococcus hulanensis]|uniref:hypothetical protein n=1 Tax=Enterococcus hulanensis TaxID=2559929 RepID=UPI0010F8D562|nr:hypothetical protein [Enterococcus hulanensis]
MKRVGLGVVLLGLFLVLVGCGNSLSKMNDGTKKAVNTVMDFKNKYNKKDNEERKDYEFDSGYFPIDLSEKEFKQAIEQDSVDKIFEAKE